MKKFIKRLMPIVCLIILVLFLSELIGGWTFLKVNGKTYVLNSYETGTEEDIKEEIGTVEFRFPYSIRPLINNTSTGVPYGTKIFTTKNNRVAAKYKDKYYIFNSTDGEGWGNGVQISLSKE